MPPQEEFYTKQEEFYTRKDVLDFLKDGESLEYADLSRSRLAGANLPKLDLKGASLEGANLQYADLTRAILKEANLKSANLMGAKLRGANLSGANLENALLDNADLLKADLRKACFKNAKLDHASLRATILSDESFKLTGCAFARLREKEGLSGVVDKLKSLENKEYPGKKEFLEDLKKILGKEQTTEYQDIILKWASSGTDFSDADLRGANLSGAKGCLQAKFDNADLRGAHGEFTGLDEHELKEVGAKVEGIIGFKKRVFDFFDVGE